jgi:hypothetical protein
MIHAKAMLSYIYEHTVSEIFFSIVYCFKKLHRELSERTKRVASFLPFDLKTKTDLASEKLCYVPCFVEILHSREFHNSSNSNICTELDRRLGLQEFGPPVISGQSAYKGKNCQP